jgi:DnaJ like chaperone protein
MGNYKKWLGGGVGWMLGGPIGGLLGFAFGSLLDEATIEVIRKEIHTATESSPETDFRLSLLLLSAFVIKADGKATKEEMEYVRNFFLRRFGAEKASSSMRIFNQLDKSNIDLHNVCGQVRSLLDYPSRLQLVHFLFGVANADGHMSKEEIHVIGRIASILGLHQTEFDSIRSMFRLPTTESAYQILGITKESTVEEVKRAYRKLTLQYHPDKVAHHGDDVQRAAKEKYQKVVEAYEAVRRERQMV